MGVVKTILLVTFVIICVLLVLFVLLQNDENSGMGVFGGMQTQAFGAHSASILTKATGVLVALFFVFAFFLAVLEKGNNRTVTEQSVQGIVSETQAEETNDTENWWKEVPAEETKAE